MPSQERYRQAERALLDAYKVDDVQEHFIEVSDLACTVRVLETGAAEAPPVLFLHGSPNAGPTWLPMVAHMQAHGAYRCLLLDLPGFGLSTPTAAPPRAHAGAVEAVLAALDVPAVHLVASLYGSGVAARFSADQPDRVRSVVHQGCPGVLPGSPPLSSTPVLGFVWSMVQLTLGGRSAASTRSMWKTIGHGPALRAGTFPPAILEWYAALLRETDTEAGNSALMSGIMRGFGFDLDHFASAEELASTPPTTLFWGTNDTTGAEDAARELQALLGGCPLELVPDAGHLPWLDAPEAAARHTCAHIEAVSHLAGRSSG